MLCNKCGKEVADNGKFCPSCGNAVEAAPFQPPAPDTLLSQNEPENSNPIQPANVTSVPPAATNYKVIGFAAVAVVVVLVLLLGKLIFGGGKPETVAKNIAEAMVSCDYDKFNKNYIVTLDTMLSDSVSGSVIEEAIKERYGVNTLKKAFEGPIKEEVVKELEEQYGAKYKFSFKVLGTEYLKEEERESVITALESSFSEIEGIDFNKIKDVCEVELEAKISGKDEEDKDEMVITCVKYKGKWKAMDRTLMSNMMSGLTY